MSSFLCRVLTLQNAASAINLTSKYRSNSDPRATADDVAELALLNIRGFQARYGADRDDIRAEVKHLRTAMRDGAGRGIPSNTDPLVAYKALSCVLYQAMEGNVPNSRPYKRWRAISDSLAHRIAFDAADAAGVGWD